MQAVGVAYRDFGAVDADAGCPTHQVHGAGRVARTESRRYRCVALHVLTQWRPVNESGGIDLFFPSACRCLFAEFLGSSDPQVFFAGWCITCVAVLGRW